MIYLSFVLLFFSPNFSYATNESACVLEGKFELMRQKFDIKDCAKNEGLDVKTFKEMCSSFSQAAAAFGAPPAKITYQVNCPEKPQAACSNYAGQKIKFFYYKRDTNGLKDAESSCKAMGGKWSNS